MLLYRNIPHQDLSHWFQKTLAPLIKNWALFLLDWIAKKGGVDGCFIGFRTRIPHTRRQQLAVETYLYIYTYIHINLKSPMKLPLADVSENARNYKGSYSKMDLLNFCNLWVSQNHLPRWESPRIGDMQNQGGHVFQNLKVGIQLWIYLLLMTNIAIEHGPVKIVSFPPHSMVSFPPVM